MSEHHSTTSAPEAIRGGHAKRATDLLGNIPGDDYLSVYPPLEDDDSTRICFSGEFPVVLPPSTEGFDDEFMSSLGAGRIGDLLAHGDGVYGQKYTHRFAAPEYPPLYSP